MHKGTIKLLHFLCEEGENFLGVDSPLREVWQQDVNRKTKEEMV